MKSWSKYSVIYKTTILTGFEKFAMDSVKVQIFDGPERIKTPYRLARIVPAGEEASIMISSEFQLGSGRFISFEARSKSKHLPTAKSECEQAINHAVAAFSLTHTPDAFDQLVYAGWIEDESKINAESWTKVVEKRQINQALIQDSFQKIIDLESQADERFRLMTKLYHKSLPYDPSEEKFLLLWVILEIFPMMGQAQYHPIATYLSPILKKDPAIIADALGIKRMHITRSKLVHSGSFDLQHQELSTSIQELEAIVEVVMREMIGLEYDGTLDAYFE